MAATNIVPHFTETEWIAPVTVAKGSICLSSWIDLTAKLGAYMNVSLGLKGTTVPASAVGISILRAYDDGTGKQTISGRIWEATWLPAGTVASTNVASGDGVLGESHIHVDSVTNFATGDKVVVFDAGLTRVEFQRVEATEAGILHLGQGLRYNHADADSDTVVDNAFGQNGIWVPGGAYVAIEVAYRTQATGSDAILRVNGQTYDYDVAG